MWLLKRKELTQAGGLRLAVTIRLIVVRASCCPHQVKVGLVINSDETQMTILMTLTLTL